MLSSKIHKCVLLYVHSPFLIMPPEVFAPSYQLSVYQLSCSVGFSMCMQPSWLLSVTCMENIWVHPLLLALLEMFPDHLGSIDAAHVDRLHSSACLHPFSPLLLPFHILFIEISPLQLIYLCISASFHIKTC